MSSAVPRQSAEVRGGVFAHECTCIFKAPWPLSGDSCCWKQNKEKKSQANGLQDFDGGDKGSRTPDLLNAIETLYQLSYIPKKENAHSLSKPGD